MNTLGDIAVAILVVTTGNTIETWSRETQEGRRRELINGDTERSETNTERWRHRRVGEES